MAKRPSSITWQCRDLSLNLGDKTLVMGILNVTPDSFSDGGQFYDVKRAQEHARQLRDEGADIIDIGGESTRPGSEPLSLQDELDRVIPVIQSLHDLDIPISIDTYKASVAKAAVDAGAVIINDISAATFDPEMPRVMAETGAGVVLMHIKGEPKNMQVNPHYDDVVQEVGNFLLRQTVELQENGITADRIVIDPGIGFGKRLEDNYVLTRHLQDLLDLGYPLLYGPSRKSFLGKVLDLSPEQRLEGTIAACTAAALAGVQIVRVHDVRAVKRALTIADLISGRGEVPA